MYALNNVTTTDDFSEKNTLRCPGTTELIISVTNAAIFLQYAFRKQGYTSDSPPWEPAPDGIFMIPNDYIRDRNVEQVRVKSAVKGKPAQVTIEAVN